MDDAPNQSPRNPPIAGPMSWPRPRLAVPTVKKNGKAASFVLLRIRKVTIAGVATLPRPTRADDAANTLQLSPCTTSNEPIAPLASAALSAMRRARPPDSRAAPRAAPAIEDAPYITQNQVTPATERLIPFSMTPAKVT
jgi:hypothetical protein